MGKVPVDRERLTMVVIIGRIVAETSFRWNVGIGSRSHCLLGEACKSLAISSIDARGNDNSIIKPTSAHRVHVGLSIIYHCTRILLIALLINDKFLRRLPLTGLDYLSIIKFNEKNLSQQFNV